jgi:hypothetical protein
MVKSDDSDKPAASVKLMVKSDDSDKPAANVKSKKKSNDLDSPAENVQIKKKSKDSDIPAENVKIKKKSKKSTPVKESKNLILAERKKDLEEELEPGEIRPPKPIIRESKLVLNEKLLERLRKPEKQVEFYQAILKSMQSAAEYPPKLVQGVSSMINPAGTALVEDIDSLASNSNSPTTPTAAAKNNRMPGNIVCGICGAVRYYAFILQAKKFGTFSCEPCRKFISKTIKMCENNQDSDEESDDEEEDIFPCLSATGKCVVPPQVSSSFGNIKNRKKENESRCQACWLKLCLIGYKLDDGLYDQLR